MKQQWISLLAKIDAYSQRERLMLFAATVAILVYLVNAMLIAPMVTKQKRLASISSEQRGAAAVADADVVGRKAAFQADPDLANRNRLRELHAQFEEQADLLRATQKGLVPPGEMLGLLHTMLNGIGKLRLVSLKTLPDAPFRTQVLGKPASDLRDAIPGLGKALVPTGSGAAAKVEPTPIALVQPEKLVFRHGVQVIVQGPYVDMLAYMEALETMPRQLFWERAQLEVEQFPNAKLTLTVYTLSLEQKWLKL